MKLDDGISFDAPPKIPVEEIPVVKIPFGDYGENSGVQISVYKIPPSKFWCIKFLWSKILSKEFQ